MRHVSNITGNNDNGPKILLSVTVAYTKDSVPSCLKTKLVMLKIVACSFQSHVEVAIREDTIR